MPRNIDTKVKALLKSDERYRNSDKELLLAFWEKEGLYLSKTQRDVFMNCTTAESITRARRKAKEEGILGDKKIEEARYKLFENERDYRAENMEFYR